MNGHKIYRITTKDHTPTGRWDEYPNLLNFKEAAASVSTRISNFTDAEFDRFLSVGLVVWGGPLEIVTTRNGKAYYDADCEPAEGAYIAVGINNAVAERRNRIQTLPAQEKE